MQSWPSAEDKNDQLPFLPLLLDHGKFSPELIFTVSDHRYVRGIAVTFVPPLNFTAEATMAQRGLSRPQRGQQWLSHVVRGPREPDFLKCALLVSAPVYFLLWVVLHPGSVFS